MKTICIDNDFKCYVEPAQRDYERLQLADAEADNAAYQAALAELGVTV